MRLGRKGTWTIAISTTLFCMERRHLSTRDLEAERYNDSICYRTQTYCRSHRSVVQLSLPEVRLGVSVSARRSSDTACQGLVSSPLGQTNAPVHGRPSLRLKLRTSLKHTYYAFFDTRAILDQAGWALHGHEQAFNDTLSHIVNPGRNSLVSLYASSLVLLLRQVNNALMSVSLASRPVLLFFICMSPPRPYLTVRALVSQSFGPSAFSRSFQTTCLKTLPR